MLEDAEVLRQQRDRERQEREQDELDRVEEGEPAGHFHHRLGVHVRVGVEDLVDGDDERRAEDQRAAGCAREHSFVRRRTCNACHESSFVLVLWRVKDVVV